MNKEEIINALKMIKNVCNSLRYCTECPFYCNSNGKCLIQATIPNNWDINEDTIVWRALK